LFFLFQESTISTPVKDVPELNECKEKDEQELPTNSETSLREDEIENQEPLVLSETTKLETSTDSKKENNTLKTQTQSNELSSTIEIVNSNEETSKEIVNKLEDVTK